jgi:hypothetical protein
MLVRLRASANAFAATGLPTLCGYCCQNVANSPAPTPALGEVLTSVEVRRSCFSSFPSFLSVKRSTKEGRKKELSCMSTPSGGRARCFRLIIRAFSRRSASASSSTRRIWPSLNPIARRWAIDIRTSLRPSGEKRVPVSPWTTGNGSDPLSRPSNGNTPFGDRQAAAFRGWATAHHHPLSRRDAIEYCRQPRHLALGRRPRAAHQAKDELELAR